MKMLGARALIVGASSGIGLATARLFVREGAQIALAARSRDKLTQIASELAPKAHVIVADVGDAESCGNIVPKAIKAMGGLSAVVYTAGLCAPSALKDLTVADFKAHLDVNLTGNFLVAQAAALYMNSHGGGSIVNLSSELSHIGMANYVHYCAAKAGVLGLTMALAAEMAPHVRINSISPGPVDTPMMATELQWFGGTQEVRDEAINRVPLKRFASAEEVAAAILFLTVDAAYATGTTLRLDGGTTMT